MSAPPDALRAALRGRYELEREIGGGGMATVYLAQDLRHRRRVAVKVMRSDLAETLGAERFLREIEIAAQLTHPHVLPLLDSAHVDDVLLYVMPFVDGGSLRQELLESGSLPRERAFAIAEQVASALSYAHRHGVVHRDVKPENILLAEGHAVVADFGIAKAISTLGGRALTRTGFPVGTPGYMSPEQAAGLTQLDERTDVYSLACVIYEMLVGDTPGFWVTDEASRLERFVDAPAAHREVLDRLSGSVEQALVRALSLRPGDRHATPDELVAHLKGAGAPARRRYSDTEMRDIVHRAADLEASAPTEGDGVTIGSVQRLGAEVGIPPAHVQRAASALDSGADRPPSVERKEGRGHWFFGGPMVIRYDETVPGEVPTEEFPVMIEEIRHTVGNVGSVNTLGNSMAWHTTNPPHQGREVHVTITPRAGKTRIRIEERVSRLAGGLYGGVWGGAGGGLTFPAVAIGLETLGSPLAAVALALGAVGGTYALARTIFTGVRNTRRDELQVLMDRLVEHARDTAG